MWFTRMVLEEWFDDYQYVIKYDIGESAVKYLTYDQIGVDLKGLPIRYGFHKGKPELRDVISNSYPGINNNHVIVTNGASEAIFSTIAAILSPGDHAIVEHPNYPSLYEIPRSLGCSVSFLKLSFSEKFVPDLDKAESMVIPQTKLVCFTHPNNPTGSMISEEMLKSIINWVEAKGLYLLFDETYREMSFESILPPAATLSPRVISVTSMSKCFGLPGIRIGWLITQDQDILDSILAIREQVTITNNAIGEEIALQVLKKKENYLQKAKEHIYRNRAFVSDWINQQNDFEWVFPDAGVISLPRIASHVTVDSEMLYRKLAEDYKTFVIPGRCFEMDNRYFRLGFGATLEEIKIGLSNLNLALNQLISN